MAKKDDRRITGIPETILMLEAVLETLCLNECELAPAAWLMIADLDRGTTKLFSLAVGIRLEISGLKVTTRSFQGRFQASIIDLANERHDLECGGSSLVANGRFAAALWTLEHKPSDGECRDFVEMSQLSRRTAAVTDIM